MKLLGALLLITGAGGLGYLAEYGLKRRITFLLKLKELLLLLESEITYKNATLGEAFWELSERKQGMEGSFLKDVFEGMEVQGRNFEDVWCEYLKKWGNDNGLTEEDLRGAFSFSDAVGICDISLQERMIRYATEQLEERIRLLKKEHEKKGKAYFYLGIAGGAMGVIIFL